MKEERTGVSTLQNTSTKKIAKGSAKIAKRSIATSQHCSIAALQHCSIATLQHCSIAALQHCIPLHSIAFHCIPLPASTQHCPPLNSCTIAKIEHSTLHELTRGFTSETILLWDVTPAFRTWEWCSAGRAGPLGRARCSCTAVLRPSAVGVGAVGGVARSGTPQMFGNAPWFSRGCNKDQKAEKQFVLYKHGRPDPQS